MVLSALIPGLELLFPDSFWAQPPHLSPWSHPPLSTHHPFWLSLLLCYLLPCWTLLFCPWLSVSPASAGWQKLFCSLLQSWCLEQDGQLIKIYGMNAWPEGHFPLKMSAVSFLHGEDLTGRVERRLGQAGESDRAALSGALLAMAAAPVWAPFVSNPCGHSSSNLLTECHPPCPSYPPCCHCVARSGSQTRSPRSPVNLPL